MAKRRKSTKCPEPINTLLDVAGAATLGLYVKHKVKKDFENGCGEESAKAAAMVFGMGSMRRGSQGTINLGGLMGLNSALKDIARQQASPYSYASQPYISPIDPPSPAIKKPVKTGLWREHCEDGSRYDLYPENFATADDYADALRAAKEAQTPTPFATEPMPPRDDEQCPKKAKYSWRKHCEDGSKYGVFPENYETADDYEDALVEAKK